MKTPGAEAEIPRETLQAWKGGDDRAFEAIVKATMKRSYAIALGIVGSGEDARDCSQEAYIAAHRARASFDCERPFFPWFYRILRNRCLNFLERRTRRSEISLEDLSASDEPPAAADGGTERRERIEAVWKALFALSPEHREIIVLRIFQDLSYREIADALAISEGTVMSRLFYARKALGNELRRMGEAPAAPEGGA